MAWAINLTPTISKIMKKSRALPLTITLGSLLLVFTLALTTLWNIVLVYNSVQLKQYAGVTGIWKQWVILGIGSFFFVVIIVGIILFVVFMSRQIILNQTQKNFIDAVTHELKTPITSLRLYVETMQRHKLEGAKRDEFLNTMLLDLEYLDSLVSHVLEAARIEFRHSNEKLENLSFMALLQESLLLIQRRYMLTAEHFSSEGCEHVTLHTDPHALRLVLINLLDNAVKYSQEPVSISIRCTQSDDAIEIAIQDQGIGIPHNEQRRIFSRFYRGLWAEQAKGSGLGLFIVREAVKQMRGKITVHSEGRDKGTTFVLKLPLS